MGSQTHRIRDSTLCRRNLRVAHGACGDDRALRERIEALPRAVVGEDRSGGEGATEVAQTAQSAVSPTASRRTRGDGRGATFSTPARGPAARDTSALSRNNLIGTGANRENRGQGPGVLSAQAMAGLSPLTEMARTSNMFCLGQPLFPPFAPVPIEKLRLRQAASLHDDGTLGSSAGGTGGLG